MIYDVRTYDLKHGKVNEYMDAVREVALPLRKEYGVELAGWFYTIIGPITQIIHIWAYDSLAHMEESEGEGWRQTRGGTKSIFHGFSLCWYRLATR